MMESMVYLIGMVVGFVGGFGMGMAYWEYKHKKTHRKHK
jgi:hypothetical protein